MFQNSSKALESGITLDNQKYITLRTDDSAIMARLKSQQLVCMRSNQAVVIARQHPDAQPGATVSAVGKVVDYLKANNF